MEKAYGMSVPAGNITQDGHRDHLHPGGEGQSARYGEVFTTDGRIKSMNLVVMADDKNFFPNYNAAPEINSKALKKYPAIAEVLDPVTKKLNNTVAQELNAQGGRGRRGPAPGGDGLDDEGGVREGGVRQPALPRERPPVPAAGTGGR